MTRRLQKRMLKHNAVT